MLTIATLCEQWFTTRQVFDCAGREVIIESRAVQSDRLA